MLYELKLISSCVY